MTAGSSVTNSTSTNSHSDNQIDCFGYRRRGGRGVVSAGGGEEVSLLDDDCDDDDDDDDDGTDVRTDGADSVVTSSTHDGGLFTLERVNSSFGSGGVSYDPTHQENDVNNKNNRNNYNNYPTSSGMNPGFPGFHGFSRKRPSATHGRVCRPEIEFKLREYDPLAESINDYLGEYYTDSVIAQY